ncbi:MAG: rRNA maturation RNase YbeY [Candidatus Staskawiczbacteria bacterium]|nr:rRNA maturation RNase YbeY [Candidatus Staskawiczbacteria bacterium]
MIEINNLAKGCAFGGVDKKVFSTVAKIVLKGENRLTQTVSLAFVDKAEIKELNKKFRKKNKPTDVLSFNINEKSYLGEVIICPEVVKEKKEDIVKVFVHGILHLCGYDHEKSKREAEIMEAKEKEYFKI